MIGLLAIELAWLSERLKSAIGAPMALPLPARGNKTALRREVPWPYELFRRPQLRRPALRERDFARAWFRLRGVATATTGILSGL